MATVSPTRLIVPTHKTIEVDGKTVRYAVYETGVVEVERVSFGDKNAKVFGSIVRDVKVGEAVAKAEGREFRKDKHFQTGRII